MVAVVVEDVIPVIVKLEFVPQVAKGTGGAPVVAPIELQFEPSANESVATDPTKFKLLAKPKFTIPVFETVTKVPVPPVVVKLLPAAPAKLRIPEIFPVFPVPAKASAAGGKAGFDRHHGGGAGP